ncbi:MAG: NADH-quinone oxidoreductase subunit NuoE [Firmicutes bacterium]|nr:NADH-quinone oxidoreductase subunit NuoE [Bacillota bacterium]
MQGSKREFPLHDQGRDDEHIFMALERYRGAPDALIPALYDVQREYGYISESAAAAIAEILGIPLSKVYGVATFYTMFRVKPEGEHIIWVCESAPCHVLGAMDILRTLETELGIKIGETTSDGKFSLKFTSCLGTCGVAPAIMIDDVVYGNLTPERVLHVLSEYR